MKYKSCLKSIKNLIYLWQAVNTYMSVIVIRSKDLKLLWGIKRKITILVYFQIWLPDVEVLNLKMFQALDVLSKLQGLWVSQNSDILYVLATRITFICAMSFDDFPLDTQTCLLQVSNEASKVTYILHLFISFILYTNSTSISNLIIFRLEVSILTIAKWSLKTIWCPSCPTTQNPSLIMTLELRILDLKQHFLFPRKRVSWK